MEAAFYLLLLIGIIGAGDIVYFHTYRCSLATRAECQREVLWHTARHFVYASQFLIIANLRLTGAALLVLVALYASDVFIAWADVWEETASRKPQGGLPRAEYFMHIVLSVLVGLYLMSVATAAWPLRHAPASIAIDPPSVPATLRWLMNAMSATALLFFVRDLRRWLRSSPTGRKIVVEVLLPAPVETVWQRTQDPAEHVKWDIRFTDIRYRDQIDARGFREMDYRTSIGFGLEVAGVGRYLHSETLAKSTFEFDSDDWKALITRGRGIWQYQRQAEGTLFRTVYDYQVRYGFVGWILDFVFRPLLQLATEWGFETLRQWCAGDENAVARRRNRWRFAVFFLKRLLGSSPRVGSAHSSLQ